MIGIRKVSPGIFVGLVLLLGLIALPWFGNAYLTTIAFGILIAYILGQSWDWVAGEMGYVNLGHYCFYGIGAYAFSIALVSHWPVWGSLVCAAIVTMIIAAMLSIPLFRLHGD